MKKSNIYFKLVTCLTLCVILIASMFLTACGEDSASGSGNIDISKLTKNKTESTTNIATEVPTEAEITEQVEATAETEKPTEEENPTEGSKDNTIKKYESNDITITPISQYETKRKFGIFSDSAKKDITVTCFLVSGIRQVTKASANIITKNSVKSNESGEYDRCLFIGQYIDNKDAPYYAMRECELKDSDKEESYILVIEMEKDLFKLSDFKYIFKINNDYFYKDLSFDKNKKDVLKPYIKNNNISEGDIFINNNELYYVNQGIHVSGVGDPTLVIGNFTESNIAMSLTSLTNNKEANISYNYKGKEDFSKMKAKMSPESNGCDISYNCLCQIAGKVKDFDKKVIECDFTIKPSGAKIIP